MGHGFLKFILLNSERKICGKVMQLYNTYKLSLKLEQ